jgi:hypothetical protein
MAWFWSLPLTVDLVSPNLGVRQGAVSNDVEMRLGDISGG